MLNLTMKQRAAYRKFIIKQTGKPTRGLSDQEIVELAETNGYDGSVIPKPLTPVETTIIETLPTVSATVPDAIIVHPIKKKEKTPMINKDTDALGAQIADLIKGSMSPDLDSEAIRAIVTEEIKKQSLPQIIHIKHEKPKKTIDVGLTHKSFTDLLKLVQTGHNAYIVGPTGSGKTYAAEQVAKALNLDFYFSGATMSPFKLFGFIDGAGNYQETAFYKAFTQGGLFCLDEIDGCSAEVIMSLNAMLAGGDHADFPNGMKARHPNFVCMATANTFGKGATTEYVGRNPLDAASLSRFVMFHFGYDSALERNMSGNETWCNTVQDMRSKAERHKLRVIISPRATQQGADLLAAGFSIAKVKEMTIYKGLDQAQIRKLEGSV